MPLDVLGCTRVTLLRSKSVFSEEKKKPLNFNVMGIDVCNYLS